LAELLARTEGAEPVTHSVMLGSTSAYLALANAPDVLGTRYDVSFSSGRLLDLISWEDCEDLVGV